MSLRAAACLLASVVSLAACGRETSPEAASREVTTVRSALDTTVVVTVTNTSGAAQTGVLVYAENYATGAFIASETTDSTGQATFSLANNEYRFATLGEGTNFYFYSSTCATPACTSASLTITIPVLVTVVDTNQVPQVDAQVLAEDSGGTFVNSAYADASGEALISVLSGTYQFATPGYGTGFFFRSTDCTVPGCTTKTLTVTEPVTITVVDGSGNPLEDVQVLAEDDEGTYVNMDYTGAAGQVQLSVNVGAYRFVTPWGDVLFTSGAPGSCVVAGCTSATIVIPDPVVVTVVNGSGQPIVGQTVLAQPEGCGASVSEETDGTGQATFTLPAGAWRFQASCGCEIFYSGSPGSCVIPGCTTAQITMICGACTGQPNGAACNDGNACTQTDTCQDNACLGGNPVTCTPQDECHAAGTCNMQTGACSNPPKPDGTSCTGGTCQAGVCSGGCAGGCPAPDQCHQPGTCNPGTGVCSYLPKANGTSCNDGDACTQVDECQAGGCVGYEPVVCAPSDSCHGVGVCNPATGTCSNPTEPCPPTVQAGADVSVQLPAAATLSGAVTQDLPQGTLSAFWVQVSGPGLAQFANPSSAQTTVTFTAAGTYTLRLIGGDGEASATDDVVVTVQPPVNNGVATGGGAPVAGETLFNLERTAGYIRLGNQPVGLHFIWVAVSSKGTIVKIDTQTGQILGEYFTSPTGQPRDPSRTTVDHNGNVWTGNRAGNSVVHVGLRENGQCVDRNGNGVIDTSQGLDDIKAWTNAGGADTDGGVTTAADECILHYTRVRNSGTRHASVDANNDVWISGWLNDSTSTPRYFDLIDGRTGLVKREEPAVGYGGYGGLIDGNGILWSARPLIRWDPSKPLTGGPEGPNWRGYSHESYGLCIDPQGNVWDTWFNSSQIRKFNPAGDQVGLFGHGAGNAQGCAADGNGHIWVAHTQLGNDVGHLRADGTHIGNVPTASGPTGLSVDAAGKIWVTLFNTRVVQRIDPNAGPLGSDGVTHVGAVDFTTPDLGGNPYNYSDMTGSTLTGMPPNGTWSFVWDSLQAGAEWGKMGWTAAITGDGSLTVRAASSTDGVAFGTSVVVRRGEDFDLPNGRYLRVTVSFKRSSTGESPLLYDLTIGTAAYQLPAQANHAPAVNAGPDRAATLPSPATLAGIVQDDGLPAGALDATWIDLGTGTLPVILTSPNTVRTDVYFEAPGTYDLRLFASDLTLSASDDVQVVVSDSPPLNVATLVVTRNQAGPLEIGNSVTITASLVDGGALPIAGHPIRFDVAGANPAASILLTGADGLARFTYTGTKAGIDNVTATALSLALSIDDTLPPFEWVTGTGPIAAAQSWIASPVHQATVMDRVPIQLSNQVTLTAGTLRYWPATHPEQVGTLATGLSGAPGAILATFDTTMLANGSYVIELDGTDNASLQRQSLVLVKVAGDYKPGRVVVERVDFTIDLPGLPITVGRRYDSLEKDTVGDFGHGWSLMLGHPKLEVDQAKNVALTMPGGRRVNFTFALTPPLVSGGPLAIVLGFLFFPSYLPEPGVFGTLTADGCPVLTANPLAPTFHPVCFFAFDPAELEYTPTEYTYTDPYGTVYVMGATGELRSIKDRQGNTLTFTPTGIVSSAGKSVTFERDGQGRITKVISPAPGVGQQPIEHHYGYDAAGDLISVELPSDDGPAVIQHTYLAHRLLTTVDPRGNPARTFTYDPVTGRLATEKDALNNETSYAYNLGTHTTTTTFPDTGVSTQVFDARGLLVSETNPLGHTTTHVYDPNRNETSRTNALEETTTATYDDRGNQTSRTDPLGPSTTTYDAFNMPIAFEDALDQTTTIEYDDRHLPKRFADALGTRFLFTSSEQGVPLTVDDAAGKRASLKYDGAGNVTSRSDFLGRVTQSTYDELGRLLTQTSPRGGVETRTYHPRGTVHVVTDALGGTRTYTYDKNDNLVQEVVAGPPGSGFASRTTTHTYNALNQLTQTVYPDTKTVSYTRDFRGNPLTMTDEANRTTTYEYDDAGQLIKTTFPDTKLTTRTYDPLGRLASVTDERNNTTTYGYQAGCGCSDRMTTVTDPLLRTTTTVYDALGRRTSVTDANNHTTTFEYDVRGHLTDTHYADTTSTHDVYDARGRRISSTDQMTKTTLYGYDDQGQLTSVTDPLGNVTAYGYDADGNLASVTDANNHVTTYEYDLLKRKTKRTLPLGQLETFAYDAVGNQTAHTDFRGKLTTMSYDARDRMLAKIPDASLLETAHGYTYTATGMRLTSTDASGTTSYTYDPRDRLLTKAASAGTLTYTYDSAGNLATIRSSNTNGTSVDYTWDAANQLVSVTDNRVGATAIAATYTPTGRPSTLSQPNGIGLTYSYNSLDRVTSMLWRQGTSPAFASWGYTYNARGQRTSATGVTGRLAGYDYDGASRLTSETITRDPRGASYNGDIAYLIDPAGNRLSRTSTLAAVASAVHDYDANDQLTSDAYDANGNTTASAGDTFAYDFENRLISKNSGAVTVTYDCDGNRVAKTVGAVTTRYLVDDLNPTGYLQVLEEVVGGAVQTRYTYATNLVSQTRGVSTTPATSYYGYDAHGNITFLTDATGAVTDAYDYDAWGNIVAQAGSTLNTRLYTGEEFDPDLGLINLRARQYRPGTGRFLTLDLAAGRPTEPLSLNRYLYAHQDPINRSDPLGLDAPGYATTSAMTATLRAPAIFVGPIGGTIASTVTGVLGLAVSCSFAILASVLDEGSYSSPDLGGAVLTLLQSVGCEAKCRFLEKEMSFERGPICVYECFIPGKPRVFHKKFEMNKYKGMTDCPRDWKDFKNWPRADN